MATTNLTEAVAERVSAAIAQADRTPTWVARRAGIPATTFLRKLRGLVDFTVAELSRIASALGIPVASLFPSDFFRAEHGVAA